MNNSGNLQGEQNYSLNIFGGSYTLDWAAPAAIPFFVGAEIFETMKDEKGVTLKGILDSASRNNRTYV